MGKVSKEESGGRIKSPLLCQLSYGPKPPQPLASTSAHLNGCDANRSEIGSGSGVIGGEPTTNKRTRNPLFGLPRKDWRDVARAHAVGWVLAGLVVLSGAGCSESTVPWELMAAIPLVGIFGWGVGVAIGWYLGVQFSARQLRKHIEEEGNGVADLWKGGGR